MDEAAQQRDLREAEARNLAAWQRRLLPVMVKMVIGLTVFFLVASSVQLLYLHSHMARTSTLDLAPALALAKPESLAENQTLELIRWKTLASLEQYALQRRYNQANILLMARVWTRYLGFVTGMTCMFIGAIFILGKLQEPASELKGDVGTWKVSLVTASPGILLSLLGAILMVTTIVTPGRIEVEDKATYLGTWAGAGQGMQLPDELLRDVPTGASNKSTTPPK